MCAMRAREYMYMYIRVGRDVCYKFIFTIQESRRGAITAPQLNAIKIPNWNGRVCAHFRRDFWDGFRPREAPTVENGFPLRGRPRITIPEMNILSLTFVRFHCSNCEHFRPAGAKPHSATINYAGVMPHSIYYAAHRMSCQIIPIRLQSSFARLAHVFVIRIACRLPHTSE